MFEVPHLPLSVSSSFLPPGRSHDHPLTSCFYCTLDFLYDFIIYLDVSLNNMNFHDYFNLYLKELIPDDFSVFFHLILSTYLFHVIVCYIVFICMAVKYSII